VRINPLEPTKHHPGSKGKLRVLRARARAEVALFNAQDAAGLRILQGRTQLNSGRSLLERRIMETLTYQPVPARALAAQLGRKAEQRFFRALANLRAAGCIARDKRGWWLVGVHL
jgi:hypothetical protein